MESLAPVTTVPIYRRPPRAKSQQSRNKVLFKSKQRLAKTVARPRSRESRGTQCSSDEVDSLSRSSYESATGRRRYSLATTATDRTVELPPAALSPRELVGDAPGDRAQRTSLRDPHPGTPWDWARRRPQSRRKTMKVGEKQQPHPQPQPRGRAAQYFHELEGDTPPASVRDSDNSTSSSGSNSTLVATILLADAEISPVDKPKVQQHTITPIKLPPSSSPPPVPSKLFPTPPRPAAPQVTRRTDTELARGGSHAASSELTPAPPPSRLKPIEQRRGAPISQKGHTEQQSPLPPPKDNQLSRLAGNSDSQRLAATSATPTRRRATPPPPLPPPKPFSYYAAKKMAPNQASGYSAGSSATAMNPAATYQHIQDMAAKRISTLDYLRKTHEGRVYWFNTLLFSQPDIQRLPSFQPPRLARRASNLLLLGLSIPAAVDSSAQSALDYIRALNALLGEFEAYQQLHPTEGGTSSLGSGSFSRAKLPKMFLRGSVSGKNRRASTATDIGLPLPPGFDSVVGAEGVESLASSTVSLASTNAAASASGTTLVGSTSAGPRPAGTNTAALPAPDASLLLPGEEYAYLLTPSIPFEPDFFEVFATLSEVLIDVYMRIAALVGSPEKVAGQPGLAEAFAKADARIRKLLVLGIVKEFEESTRSGVKGEMAGVGRVVLGGLM